MIKLTTGSSPPSEEDEDNEHFPTNLDLEVSYLVPTLQARFGCLAPGINAVHKDPEAPLGAPEQDERQRSFAGGLRQGHQPSLCFGSTGDIKQPQMATHFL